MPSIYILLTRTNSTLSRVIASHTKEDYVHASIILNNHVEHGYSFSRRKMTKADLSKKIILSGLPILKMYSVVFMN